MRPWFPYVVAALLVSPGSAFAEARRSPPRELSYAEQTFLEGQRLFFEKRFDEALPLFEQSFELQHSPNSRLYVARCLAKLGELLDAYRVYRDVVVQISELDEPGRYAATQLAASEERSAVKKKLAVVRLSLSSRPDGLEILINGEAVEQDALQKEHYADPGRVVLRTQAPGYHDYEHAFTADGGEVTEVSLILADSKVVYYPKPVPVAAPSASPERHPAEDWAWASAGVGVLGIATWGVFAVQAERRFYRIQPQCEAGSCPLDQVRRGRQETFVSNLSLGVGLLGLTSAGALWVWSRNSGAERGQERPPGNEVGVSVGSGTVDLTGTF